MRYIGENKVSEIGLGLANLDQSDYDSIGYGLSYLAEHGINVIDTADVYADGAAEQLLGRALVYYPKNFFKVSTKVSLRGEYNSYEEFNKDILQKMYTQANVLNVDKIDYYGIHNLAENGIAIWNYYKNLDVTRVFENMKSSGFVDKIGFWYYGNKDKLEYLLKEYDWNYVGLSHNVFDFHKDCYELLLKYQDEHPGFMIFNYEVFDKGLLFDSYELNGYNSQELALKYCLDGRSVSIIGITNIAQYDESVGIYNKMVNVDINPVYYSLMRGYYKGMTILWNDSISRIEKDTYNSIYARNRFVLRRDREWYDALIKSGKFDERFLVE